MRKLLIFCLVALVFSCAEDANLPQQQQVGQFIRVENGRIAFDSDDTRKATITQLNRMDEQSLDNWEKQFNINSFRKFFKTNTDYSLYTDLQKDVFNMPTSHQATLNVDGEIQVGNSIIWYNKGIKHFIADKNEAFLREVKADPSKSLVKGAYELSQVNNDGLPEGRITLGLGGKSSSHQYPFNYLNDSGSKRKYVHELWAFAETGNFSGGYSWHSILYLLIKLEWYGNSSHDWKLSSQNRDINYNVNYSIRFTNLHHALATCFNDTMPADGTSYFTGNRTSSGNITRNSMLQVNIFEASDNQYTTCLSSAPQISVELTGSITQHISDDVSANEWTDSAAPLW